MLNLKSRNTDDCKKDSSIREFRLLIELTTLLLDQITFPSGFCYICPTQLLYVYSIFLTIYGNLGVFFFHGGNLPFFLYPSPITYSLTPCETMERMINDILVWYLDSNKLITNIQFEFSSQRSATCHLVKQGTFIRDAFILKDMLHLYCSIMKKHPI